MSAAKRDAIYDTEARVGEDDSARRAGLDEENLSGDGAVDWEEVKPVGEKRIGASRDLTPKILAKAHAKIHTESARHDAFGRPVTEDGLARRLNFCFTFFL